MNRRIRLAGVVVVVAGVVFLGVFRTGQAAVDDRSFAGGDFKVSIAATPAFLANISTDHVVADLVNPQSPDAVFGPADCRMVVVFYDAKGDVMQSSDLSVGPGQTGVVELDSQNAPPTNPPSPIRVAFHVLGDGNGPPRPCLAIPSVQVIDGKALRTSLVVPLIVR